MIKESWVYPSDGSAPYRRGERPTTMSVSRGPTILPDLPDFVSPVDGKHYSGRAGMREHNLRNDVVPMADLQGLPLLTTNTDTRSTSQKRADAETRKRLIIQQVDKHYR